MPTSTDVTKLNINELTETQYDAAVLGGVIGANDLSFLTDVDIETQVSIMPVASADELGKVYQFIGTTDANYTHGYFYECVSDGLQPATYSWSNVQVQASSGGLPSQTGQSGKFLTTDGTDASWSDKPLVNNMNSTYSPYGVVISENPINQWNIVAIGKDLSVSGGSGSVIIGYQAKTNQSYVLSIGQGAEANGNYSIALGYTAKVTAVGGIQLNSSGGYATNSDANTFKVANVNGNYEIMSADGTIPSDRLKNAINKYSTMPTATSTNEGWIIQYTGVTDSTYTHGYIYECVSDGGNPATYSWSAVSVQAGGGGSSYTAGTGVDITGGVISVTSPTLTNQSTAVSSVMLFTGSYSGYPLASNNVIVGYNSKVGYNQNSTSSQNVVVGSTVNIRNATGCIAIGAGSGDGSTSSTSYGIAVGKSAKYNADYAIQLGYNATNSDANTFKVANNNGNFEMMSADGTIPAARHASLPASDGTYVLKLVISGGVPTLSWVAE